MRGCLFVLVIGLAFLALGSWFAAPPLTALAVGASLDAAGFDTADAPSIVVDFGSPGDLLAGRARSVRVSTTEGRAQGVSWRAATIALTHVELIGGGFATVDIDLDAPTFDAGPGAARLGALRLTTRGSSRSADTRITISSEQLVQVGRDAFLERFGAVPEGMALRPPDILTGTLRGVPFGAVLRVDSGTLIVDPDTAAAPTVELFRPAGDVPFRMEAVAIEAGNLVIIGSLDVGTMLGR